MTSKEHCYNPSNLVKLEVFLDLNCPDSYDAFLIMRSLAEYYKNNDKVMIIAHMHPLSYHRNAMLCTQGLFAILDLVPDKALNYIELTLSMWEELGVANTRNMTEYEVLTEVLEIAVRSTGVDPLDFVSTIDGYREHVKKVWKYAVRRGVAGTANYFINGIAMMVSDNTNLEQWKQFIDNTLARMDESLLEWD